MKKLTIVIFILMLSQIGEAATFSFSGEITMIRSHAEYWGGHTWIQIKGVKDVEGCSQSDQGAGLLTYMLVHKEEKNIYSLLLAAKMANKSVGVTFTSDSLINSLCTIKYADVK